LFPLFIPKLKKAPTLLIGSEVTEEFKNWTEASPLEFVDKNTPPTLFINSSQPRFHAGRDDMMKKLKSYNIPTEFHELKIRHILLVGGTMVWRL
jgi:hypothetical protein